MAVTLSPWPSSPVALANAVARLKAVIAGRAALSDDDAAHLGAVASALVEQYAPGAPAALKNEAVIRAAGYLAGSDFGAVAAEEMGPQKTEYSTNHAAMFRNSGAAALLSRWRVRRAGKIG